MVSNPLARPRRAIQLPGLLPPALLLVGILLLLPELFKRIDEDPGLEDLDLLLRPVPTVDLHVLQRLQRADTLLAGLVVGIEVHVPEDRVLAVQVPRGPVRDEELAAVGVFALVRHAERAPRVVLQWPLEFVAEVAAPDARPAFPRPCRVPTLDHEVADVAVEGHAVVVAFLR